MTVKTPATTVERLAAGFHRCFTDCDVGDDVFADDAFCNGGWDDALRARHAAEAPMIATVNEGASR